MALEAMLRPSSGSSGMMSSRNNLPSRSKALNCGFEEGLSSELNSVMPNFMDPMELAKTPFKGEVSLKYFVAIIQMHNLSPRNSILDVFFLFI